jgi:hypothetical protein
MNVLLLLAGPRSIVLARATKGGRYFPNWKVVFLSSAFAKKAQFLGYLAYSRKKRIRDRRKTLRDPDSQT